MALQPAGLCTYLARPVEGRFAGDVVEGAADGVSPVQRALGTPQDFDPLYVVEGVFRGRDPEVLGVDPVVVGRDTGIAAECPEVPADAADADVVGVARGGGNEVDEFVRRLDAELLDRVLVQRGDGDGCVGDRGLALFSRDHNLFDNALTRCLVLWVLLILCRRADC